MSTKANALQEQGAISNHYRQSNYTIKKFPPYGKRLDELRRKGLVPSMRVIVTTDWCIGKLFPRIIITPNTPASSYKFNYLVGLHVQVVYFDRDAAMLPDLTAEIMLIKPATLAVFNMDAVKRGEPAYTVLYSQSVIEVAA